MDLFSEAARRDPYPVYRQLRARTPVVYVPAANLYVLLGYDAVRRALTDHATFSSNVAPARGDTFEWLVFMDPPRHTELRALISKAFTPRSIAALEPRIRELSHALLDGLGDTFDLVASYATPLPMMVIAELFGVPPADWRMLAGWSEAIVSLADTISGVGADAAAAAFAAADRDMIAYFGEHLAARRVRPADDLLSRLAGAELAEHELVRFCQLLLAAGTETTTNLISNAVLSLIEHPLTVSIPRFLEEVLRHRSPVQGMFRVTRHAVELDGVTLPAGAFVVTGIGAANRDPRVFPDADRFDPAREAKPHLAFGHGIHFCLGAPLSRLEARIAFEDLVSRFARFELVDAAWPPRGAFHVHGPASLPIHAHRSAPP